MQSLSRQGEVDRAGRELRSRHRRRMPPRRRVVVRCHPQASQGQVRARPDRDADSPRWPAADHLHAVRTDPAHGGQTGQRAARSGGDCSHPASRGSTCRPRLAFRTCSGISPTTKPGRRPLRRRSSDAFEQGRKVLVLTERTEHLDAIDAALDGQVPPPFILHGRMSRKQRAALIAELDALPPEAPRVLLATGKLVGEGFDHPPLDTLVLAMPISWKGTLAAVRRPAAPGARQQDRRADHRFRGHRPSCVAADVGQATARLPGDGVPNGDQW